MDYSNLVPMLQAIQLGTPTPTVRVPWNEPGIIGKVLDAGAMGVIVPLVNSREECEAAVQATRYAPAGHRSFGPTRVGAVEGADYFDRANTDVACIPMVETAQAVERIDDILSVDGVEAIYVGPADLAISLGLPDSTDDAAFNDVLDTIVAACNRHGVVPGIHATAKLVAERSERGFRMITLGGRSRRAARRGGQRPGHRPRDQRRRERLDLLTAALGGPGRSTTCGCLIKTLGVRCGVCVALEGSGWLAL